jgi:uncharacterized protein (DUF736 family)
MYQIYYKKGNEMIIGHLVPLNNKKEGREYKEWLQLIIEPPFMGRLSATMIMNENKKPNSNEPDFVFYENITKRGDKEKFNGKTFRSRIIGGAWKTISKDGKTEYLKASIDTPLVKDGKFSFSMFLSKPNANETSEDIFWLYDAVWNSYNPNKNNTSNYDSWEHQ